MSTDFGNGLEFLVDRELRAADTGLETVVFQKRKPPLAEEFNFFQEIQNLDKRKTLAAQIQSGILDFALGGLSETILPSRNSVLPSLADSANQFALQNFRAVVDGMLIDVIASRVNGGTLSADGATGVNGKFNVVKLPAPPEVGGEPRVDLVFLEVWRGPLGTGASTVNKPSAGNIYKHGNTQYVGSSLADEMVDPAFNIETSKRVQVLYRIRVVDTVTLEGYLPSTGTPDGINFGSRVKARGGNVTDSDTAYTFSSMWESGDYGLYRAGDGSTAAKQALKSVDGYTYAIPLVAVVRRTKNLATGYTKLNPNASSVSILDDVASDRPDGLFYDEIAAADIIDLRHKVLPGAPDFSQLLQKSLRKLMAGSLRTSLVTSVNSLTKGVMLTEIDSITAPGNITSASSVSIATPDGTRRAFTNQSVEQTTLGSVTYATEQTGTLVQFYNTDPKKIVIDTSVLGSDATVVFDPADANTFPIVTKGTTVVTFENNWAYETEFSEASIEITTNDIDENALTVGDVLTVQFQLRFPGSGLRSTPKQVRRVRNEAVAFDTALYSREMAFTVDDASRTLDVDHYVKLALPSQEGTEHGPTNGFSDVMVDYPVHSFTGASSGVTDNLKGATRIREYFVVGSAAVTYVIPASVDGQKVVGVIEASQTETGSSYTRLNISSANKGLDEVTDWSVTLQLPVGQADFSDQTLRFSLVLRNVSAAVSAESRGVLEFGKDGYLVIESLADGGNNTQQFSTADGSLILSMPKYTRADGTEQYYGFVNGFMRTLTLTVDNDGEASGLGTSNLIVTFSGDLLNTNDTLEVPVLTTYTPPEDDFIDITYSYRPYQGQGSAVSLEDCEILSIAPGLLHTLGTGASDGGQDPNLTALAQYLPLPGSFTEGVLDATLVSLSSDATDGRTPADFPSFKKALHRIDLSQAGSQGSAPMVGDVLKVSDNAAVDPTRGVADQSLSILVDSESDSQLFSLKTPYITVAQAHQVVWSALVKHPATGELLLVVVVKMLSSGSRGGADLLGQSSSDVAFDVFRLEQRPLLSI